MGTAPRRYSKSLGDDSGSDVIDGRPRRFDSATLLLLLPALFGYSCSAASAPVNSQALMRLQTTKSVATLPSDVRLVRVKLGSGQDELRDLDLAAAQQLGPLVASELARRGFRILETPTNKVTDDIRSAYDQIAYEQKYELQHPTLEGDRPLAEPALAISKETGADGLVFVELGGAERTGGSVAAEVALDVIIAAGSFGTLIPIKHPNAAAVIRVSFVDGQSGAILWSNAVQETWGFSFPNFEHDDLSKLVTEVFQKFPTLGSKGRGDDQKKL